MNKSALFKKSHALTKATVKAGDSYSATFALCLKEIYAQSQIKTVHIELFATWFRANGIKLGTAKNGTIYGEVAVDSPAFNMLKNGLKIVATHLKSGSTRTIEFSGEHGKEFFNYNNDNKVRFYGTETRNIKK